MPIKIDKLIPIPKPGRKGWLARYPFRQMKVGDSFFVPGRNVQQMSNSGAQYRKLFGHRYTVRSVVEGGKKGCRVWRTK